MKKEVKKIIRDIKSIKIQGARNIAKSALKAYHLEKTKKVKQALLNARPTEPMLHHVLNLLGKYDYKKILAHFDSAQTAINKLVFKLIKNNSTIFTHCHSTNVTKALIYAKKYGKKFQVYNTETRHLFQGRRTAKELSRHGIKVTTFIDSGASLAIKKSDLVLFGADAVLKSGAINKIGSGMFAEIAKDNKKPVFIVADSWKFSPKNIPIEQRALNEVWNNAPEKIKINNPAFEFIQGKFIKAIVSELGMLSVDNFSKKAGKLLT
jgi:translation initiation factor 2B subunit (eIF-2B alpha/beta/delta family)